VHLLFLIGFRNRYVSLFQWAWSYFTFERGPASFPVRTKRCCALGQLMWALDPVVSSSPKELRSLTEKKAKRKEFVYDESHGASRS
jgi:hypothetical protein